MIYNNIAHDNEGGAFAIGGQNSIVVGNRTYNNGRARQGHSGFVARVNSARGTTATHSVFIGNVAYDIRYSNSNATQDYGYVEQAAGLTDIKHLGSDYNRNRVGPAKSQGGHAMQMQVSTEMKNELRRLADDPDLPDTARRAVRSISLDRNTVWASVTNCPRMGGCRLSDPFEAQDPCVCTALVTTTFARSSL